MNAIITKVKLQNYKRFTNYVIEPNARINILVGDNEVGKSTVLEAIDLVISGSIHKVESIGIEKLLNINAVSNFLRGERTFNNLPVLRVELYLSGEFSFPMKGKNNTDKKPCFGIRLVCEPNEDFRSEITEMISGVSNYFPYDYYSIRFSTFADEGYSSNRRVIHSLLIDNANMNGEYATNEFVRRVYLRETQDNITERAIHKSKYRHLRKRFSDMCLMDLNDRLSIPQATCKFGLKTTGISDFENDLMIFEDDIAINCKGMGRQVFVKTDYAIERSKDNVNIVLIEEPENHLSPTNLRKLIEHIGEMKEGQLFITTHSSEISTGLQLRNVLIMHSEEDSNPIMLNDLSDNTAKYFIKSPPASIVEFALAKKSILVEGPSEFMLMDVFYKSVTGNKPENDDVHIVNVRGLSFKRYLEIAQQTNCKVAVITDNDKDIKKNCEQKYAEYNESPNIRIFYEEDADNYTFEVAVYKSNALLMDKLFNNEALDYMLNNKTEAAFTLLDQSDPIVVPDYILRAIEWIRK